MAKIAEYMGRASGDEIGMLTARNRPQNVKKWSWNRKNRHWGHPAAKTGRNGGGRNCEIRENRENGRKTTNFTNYANGEQKQAERTLGVPGKDWEQPKRGFLAGKQEWGRKTGGRTVRN